MNVVAKYFQELTDSCGTAWNQFWFSRVDPRGMCVLRLATGLLALCYLLGFSADLVTWFGPDGLMPIDTAQQLTAEADENWNARASYLYYVDDPALLWTVHIFGILVAVAFTAGLATRITSVLTLAVVLSYIHRAPMLTGQFEPVLTLLLFYLCLAPCGQQLSVDSWLKRWRDPVANTPPSLAAGICLRLMQVHIAALYLMMALTKLGGSDAWWAGEAVWWLIAHTESRLVNWTSLASWEYLLNLWTQGVVVLEFLFALLIWHRLARPVLLAATVAHWLLLGLVTGLLSYAAAMLVANLVFFSPQMLENFWPRRQLRSA